MKDSGFSLIELLVAMAILGVLLAIAIPSYRSYIVKSRRIEATATLTQIQLAQEKHRGNNLSYATLPELGMAPTSSYYAFSATPDGDNYTLKAVAIGDQASDAACATMSIIQSATGLSHSPASCWK